jgi:hypothetical protein
MYTELQRTFVLVAAFRSLIFGKKLGDVSDHLKGCTIGLENDSLFTNALVVDTKSCGSAPIISLCRNPSRYGESTKKHALRRSLSKALLGLCVAMAAPVELHSLQWLYFLNTSSTTRNERYC